MGKDKNLHAGHRARAMELLLNNASALTDHQILEVLLFYVVPRIDTNPLAHRLIKIFGDINGDGIANGIDSNILSKIIAGIHNQPYTNADLNGDGSVNAMDCQLMKRLLAGII